MIPIVAPVPGRVSRLLVSRGDQVLRGQTVCELEVMAMQQLVVARCVGEVRLVLVQVGDPVVQGELLVEITPL